MHYPGDVIPLLLDLSGVPSASTVMVTILNTLDDTAVILAAPNIKSAAMQLMPGSDHVYKYLWFTSGLNDGTYLALVSYMLDGTPVTGSYLEVIQLGDSRILAEVARQADVAKAADTATAADTLQKADYVAPQDDPYIQEIRNRLLAMPDQVASEATLATMSSLLADIHDAEFGSWIKNDTTHKFRMLRKDGSLLIEFSTTNDAGQQARLRS